MSEVKQTLMEVCQDRLESFCPRETTQDCELAAGVMTLAQSLCPPRYKPNKTENILQPATVLWPNSQLSNTQQSVLCVDPRERLLPIGGFQSLCMFPHFKRDES